MEDLLRTLSVYVATGVEIVAVLVIAYGSLEAVAGLAQVITGRRA